jgi:thiosulfate/3-mercaptopyruvate sulfurtransferase
MNLAPLIAPTDLDALRQQADVVVVDVRHDLMQPAAGRTAWQTGHIPGAIHLHLDDDLSGPKTGQNGRHPLPDPSTLADRLGRIGVGDGSRVIAYDDAGGAFAARLWWLLRWLGHDAVAVLDGGWQAWLAAGLPVSTVPATARSPQILVARPHTDWVVGVDSVAIGLADGSQMVLDARAPERFRGEVEPIDPVAGHIPGACNRFHRNNLAADGGFKDAATLRAELLEVLNGRSAGELVCQCGSGVTACHNLLALAVAGLEGARLYAGSWSEWCSDPARPVATGEA